MSKIAPFAFALAGSLMLTAAAFAASPQASAPSAPTVSSRLAADMQMVVAHAYAHLRKEPNTHSDILATLKKGTKLDVIEKVANGKWAHVKVDKLEGYVATSLLK